MQNILKSKSTFIFDLDGTLVDMEEFTKESYSMILKSRFDLDLTHVDYLKHFSGTRTGEAYETYLASKSIGDYDLDKLVNEFRAIKRDGLENHIKDVVKLKPGTQEYLAKLKANKHKVALATSAIKEFALLILDSFDIKKYFDLILTAQDVTKGKPDPQVYNLALEKLGSTKEESVVFEDSLSGIQAAKKAGIYCIAIRTKGLNDKAVKLADAAIASYHELVKPKENIENSKS